MDPRLVFAILVGKIIQAANKIRGTGGTAAPGLYALKIDPKLVHKLSKINNLKSTVVSGTNGKTTTSRLIFEILSSKYKIIHNRQGSNLLRGIASTLIEKSTILGKITADLALWEADEAALGQIAEELEIKNLILLNLFRDQLDRYGEIDTIRKKWIIIVKNLSPNASLILNADDPSTNYLAAKTTAKTLFFGVEADKINLEPQENVADVKYCINCNSKLKYKKLYSAHLGIYACSGCTFERKAPQVKATNIEFKPNFSTRLTISINHKLLTINYPLPGLFNVYNILAALSLTSTFGLPTKTILAKIKSFTPAFGRFEKFKVKNKNVTIFLIKNPAGANEVIRTLAIKNGLELLIILNDNIADGRDVSWIWDTNWEAIRDKVTTVFTSGNRTFDMALRLKYAKFKLPRQNINPNLRETLEKALEKSTNLIILPTYSSLLELKTLLLEKGVKGWHTQ